MREITTEEYQRIKGIARTVCSCSGREDLWEDVAQEAAVVAARSSTPHANWKIKGLVFDALRAITRHRCIHKGDFIQADKLLKTLLVGHRRDDEVIDIKDALTAAVEESTEREKTTMALITRGMNMRAAAEAQGLTEARICQLRGAFKRRFYEVLEGQ